jgi:hypothetical protein
MPTSVLTLGGIAFDDFSTPSGMGAGGNQAMIVHKLSGGSRVIDVLGPDEADIAWRGEFFGDDAYTNALTIDGLRAGGQVQSLSFAGQSRQVIINTFTWQIHREPVWVAYEISCTVYQNPSLGNLSPTGDAGSVDNLVGSDLGSASSAAGADPANALASGTAPL